MVEQKTKTTIYLCGPTVYSDVHIGNLRPIITFDIILRSFTFLKKDFVFIHNITDIDDKIVKRALEEQKPELELASFYTKKYQEILKQANVQKPTHLPKVTSNMKLIISFIKKMIQKGFAYEKNGEVYFEIAKTPNYGYLSNRQESKENKKDFVLWKKVSKGITFNSPWAKGRPGWHSECAAFVNYYAKSQSLTIHAGGIDLLFPHHENENVQYLAANNVPIANQWVHVGKLNFQGQKMSKSLQNVFLAKDFFDQYDPNVLRLIFLNSSVKSHLNLTSLLIDQNLALLKKIKKSFFAFQLLSKQKEAFSITEEQKVTLENFCVEISNFNFSKAMKLFHLTLKKFNSTPKYSNGLQFLEMIKIIGFETSNWKLSKENIEKYFKWKKEVKNKNFKIADNIKRELTKKGII